MWTNFIGLALVQLAMFVVASLWWGVSWRSMSGTLWRSAALGLPLGLIFDFVIGRFSFVFTYEPFFPTWMFYLLNGLISYGLAVATVSLIPEELPRISSRKNLQYTLPIAALCLILLLRPFMLPDIVALFIRGALVLAIAESAAIWRRVEAPLTLAVKNHLSPLLRLWVFSVILGLVYEIANAVFPVWRWRPLNGISYLIHETVMVLAGYFVLAYAIVVFIHISSARWSDLRFKAYSQ